MAAKEQVEENAYITIWNNGGRNNVWNPNSVVSPSVIAGRTHFDIHHSQKIHHTTSINKLDDPITEFISVIFFFFFEFREATTTKCARRSA